MNIPSVPVDPAIQEQMVIHAKARQLYEEFYRQLRLRTGTPRGVSVARQRTFDSQQKTFIAAATLCHKNNWLVEHYVRHVFGSVRKSQRYIIPTDLTRDYIVQQYELAIASSNNQYLPRTVFELQVTELLSLMRSTGASELTLLRSAMMPFYGWFRVVYPEHVDPFILEIFGQMARDELAEDRTLRLFMRKHYPRGVKALEERFGRFGDVMEELHV